MTRQECEHKVLDLLEQIRATIKQYNPEINGCNLCVAGDMVWVFKLEEDENGEPISGKYLLDAVRTVAED